MSGDVKKVHRIVLHTEGINYRPDLTREKKEKQAELISSCLRF